MSGGISATAIAAYGAMAATAIGGVVSYEAASANAKAQENAAQYNAAVAKNNQTLADQYAQRATQTGEVEAQNKEQQTAQQEGMIRASVGASGLDANSGSALRLQQDTAQLGATDVATIRNNAAQQAYGYTTQGVGFGNQAALDQSQGQNAAKAGELGEWSSIIGAASGVSSKWANFQTSGTL